MIKAFFKYFISAILNNAVSKGVFPVELKHADIKSIYKKESRNQKKNYRPVNILPSLSKSLTVVSMINLKITLRYCQNISVDLEKGLTHNIAYQSLQKNHEILIVGAASTSAALFTDLSKVFDCQQHDSIIAKLHAYCIKEGSLNLFLSYLKRKQRVRLNNTLHGQTFYLVCLKDLPFVI